MLSSCRIFSQYFRINAESNEIIIHDCTQNLHGIFLRKEILELTPLGNNCQIICQLKINFEHDHRFKLCPLEYIYN